jgi:alpha-beta hydrolase superfamily lysophospholipase
VTEHQSISDWSIPGADGQTIFGNTHLPDADARGAIVIVHGFKGYKDYGMFPRLAREFAGGGRSGLIAHRFNFSHSGMTNRLETFERPDLFERDTWSKQVFDLSAVLQAIARNELPGNGLSLFVLGHSRGGVTAFLTADRLTELGRLPDLAGVIALASSSTCNSFGAEESRVLLEQGWLESPSSRTGQPLRVGRAFLQEQLDDPAAHDLLAHVRRLGERVPILIIHGENDPTVPVQCAHDLASAAGPRATQHIV